ncbi:phosphomannomutase [Rhodovulum sp. 12E13]|uniref:phosphomannomutase n=1 Tax=Rhodovulum sp. 12E13 TaxID=2203891 RepID=UPI000E146B50|nr:phosphomannomutase [Rhodovulum sp. 12E13]RDC75382.1 phosphomannomutase [Rhodovulum sp. 12E13]
MARLDCFKSYDVRGRLGVDLDAGIARRIGRGFADALRPGLVVTGRDVRESSPALQAALIEGLRAGGADVIDIGLCGTEEVYFATDRFGAGGGIMVTASHNPVDWNGMKLVGPGATPLSAEAGLGAVRAAAEAGDAEPAANRGELRSEDPRAAFVARCLSFVEVGALRPLTILVNSGNGAAGPTFDAVAAALLAAGAPLTFERMWHDADPAFPNGIPNPLLPENQPATAEAVRAAGADFGVAFDGDFDRCFFFDETGVFVPGEYVVGLLAGAFLAKEAGAKIVHDPRVVLNTRAVIAGAGGEAVVSRTGHAHLKAKMREVDAVYGGEMSAHHYFRDFMYCDSGMIPWLLVAEHVSRTGRSLGDLVAGARAAYPSSGEINFRLADAEAARAAFESAYAPSAREVDRLDGLSLTFDGWRANLRASNTEPVLRLNVEAAGDVGLVAAKVAEISALLKDAGGQG